MLNTEDFSSFLKIHVIIEAGAVYAIDLTMVRLWLYLIVSFEPCTYEYYKLENKF